MALTLAYLSDARQNGRLHESAMRVLEQHIAQSDQESEFGRVAEKLAYLSPSDRIFRLLDNGYDALLCFEGEELNGYCAFQRHNASRTTSVFRFYTIEEHRGRNVGPIMLKKLIEDTCKSDQDAVQLSIKHGVGKRCLDILQKRYFKDFIVTPEMGMIRKATNPA